MDDVWAIQILKGFALNLQWEEAVEFYVSVYRHI